MTAETLRPSPHEAGTMMRRATRASVAVAGTLVAVKLGAWLATDSVSLLSSFLDSLLDAASSLINLWAVNQALTPADREHRFGHGKAEPLASLGQSAFIGGSAALILFEALGRLVRPVSISNTGIGIAVMVFAIAVTLAIVLYEQRVVRLTGSLIVRADSFHYRSHLVLDLGVIVSLALSRAFGWLALDPLVGGAIAMWIAYGAWQMARQSLVQLMDREMPDAERGRIRAIALADPRVRAVHDLRTRTSGPSAFIQIHLELDGALTLTEAHVISDKVEADIRAAYPHADIIIHQDPEGVEEARDTFASAR